MSEFDAIERVAIRAERDRLAKTRLPSNLTAGGCLLLLLGGVMFAALPTFLADSTQTEDSTAIIMMVAIVALIVTGIWLTVRGNHKRRFVRAQVKSAITELQQFPALATDARRAAAVRLLWYLPNRDWKRRVETLCAKTPEALLYTVAVRGVLEDGGGKQRSKRARSGRW
jgi:hypothetical protein